MARARGSGLSPLPRRPRTSTRKKPARKRSRRRRTYNGAVPGAGAAVFPNLVGAEGRLAIVTERCRAGQCRRADPARNTTIAGSWRIEMAGSTSEADGPTKPDRISLRQAIPGRIGCTSPQAHSGSRGTPRELAPEHRHCRRPTAQAETALARQRHRAQNGLKRHDAALNLGRHKTRTTSAEMADRCFAQAHGASPPWSEKLTTAMAEQV